MSVRFGRFAIVGALGFVIQLATLTFLTAAGWPYLLAAAIAVEFAALHNFLWHERWTWRDRALPRRTVGQRLVDYHLTTASIAIAGNVLLTGAIVEVFGAPPILANVGAVAIQASASFAVADRWVFRSNRLGVAALRRERARERATRTERAGASGARESVWGV
jgi:dolichol-phosphate mannosyltransferase